MSAYAKLTRAMATSVRDVLYLPSRDVTADIAFYRDVLGARIASVRETLGVQVAELEISPRGPRVTLAEQLAGGQPVVLRETSDLDATLAELRTLGLEPSERLELPIGPSVIFRSPGGQQLGLYQPAGAERVSTWSPAQTVAERR
jgi:hypothetical protein